MNEPATLPFATRPCRCRAEHAPSVPYVHLHHIHPQAEGGPDTDDNLVPICPATHDWTHLILRAFAKAGAVVPRRVTWPTYAYGLACEGWRRMELTRTGPTPP